MQSGTTTLDTQEYLDLLEIKKQHSLLATKMKDERTFGFKSMYGATIYVISKDKVAQEMKESFEQENEKLLKRQSSLREKESKIEDWKKMYYNNTKEQLEAIKNDDEYHTNVISFGWRSFSLGCFAGIGIATTIISLLYLISK
jgi:hypothetical protein